MDGREGWRDENEQVGQSPTKENSAHMWTESMAPGGAQIQQGFPAQEHVYKVGPC